MACNIVHNDVIKWKHFPRYRPFVQGIHRSPVNSPHKGQWRGALMLSLTCVWINSWVSNHEAGDLRRYRAHYDVTLMAACRSSDTVRCLIGIFCHQPNLFAKLRKCYREALNCPRRNILLGSHRIVRSRPGYGTNDLAYHATSFALFNRSQAS